MILGIAALVRTAQRRRALVLVGFISNKFRKSLILLQNFDLQVLLPIATSRVGARILMPMLLMNHRAPPCGLAIQTKRLITPLLSALREMFEV